MLDVAGAAALTVGAGTFSPLELPDDVAFVAALSSDGAELVGADLAFNGTSVNDTSAVFVGGGLRVDGEAVIHDAFFDATATIPAADFDVDATLRFVFNAYEVFYTHVHATRRRRRRSPRY